RRENITRHCADRAPGDRPSAPRSYSVRCQPPANKPGPACVLSSMPKTDTRASSTPLRLWPGVAIVLVQWAARFGLPAISPDLVIYGVAAGLGGGLALVIWWLFFSRAAWVDRIFAIVVMAVAMGVTWPFLHVSISTGAMGALFPMLALPGICLAF